jgi:hypothetical protein
LSDENVYIHFFKIVWNLANLGQNLGKILRIFNRKILELDKSSVVNVNKILESLKHLCTDGSIGKLTGNLEKSDKILENLQLMDHQVGGIFNKESKPILFFIRTIIKEINKGLQPFFLLEMFEYLEKALWGEI